jgi:exodeoxyribonuclease VII small subunit
MERRGHRVCAPALTSLIFLHATHTAVPTTGLSMNFEKSLNRLNDIMAALEAEQVGLDASLKLFEEGIELLRVASAELDKAETRVQMLIEKSDGGFDLREMDL